MKMIFKEIKVKLSREEVRLDPEQKPRNSNQTKATLLKKSLKKIRKKVFRHRRTELGVQGGRRWPEAARPAEGPPLK
jgi:hypothetical protein